MPHLKRGGVWLAVCAAVIFAVACGDPDPPPPPVDVVRAPDELTDAASGPVLRQRTTPPSDPRLHTRQGGRLCDRSAARDPEPFRDSVPTFAKEDLSVGPTFRCRLRAGRPHIRLTALGDSAGWLDSVLVHSPASARGPRQVLHLDDSEPHPLGADFLQGVDLNRDGWMDVKVEMFRGVTGNLIVDVFMFDPSRDRFVRDTVLSGESHADPLDGRPCVRTGWVFGDAGMLHTHTEYCWVDARWVVAWSEHQRDTVLVPGNERVYFRTTRRRRTDATYTSRLDTVKMDPSYY
jgi:hypothetical protein